jgi:hypothetical protein
MTSKPLYQHMASAIDAMQRCKADANAIRANAPGAPHESFLELREEWALRWKDRLHAMLDALPHGSGLDADWHYVGDKCNADRITLSTSYHNMDTNGFYCGWSDLTVTVKPSLIHGINLRITGGDSDLKDYLYDILSQALCELHESEAFVSNTELESKS